MRFALFFIFSSQLLIGKTSTLLDSLKFELQNAKVDTQQVILLNKMAWESHRNFPDSSRIYVNQALDLAMSISYKKGEARAMNLIAILESMAGNSDSSQILNTKALEIGKQIKDPWIISITSNDLAIYFAEIGDNESALKLYQLSLENTIALKDTFGIVITLFNLGLFHNNLGNDKDQDEYFIKAYEFGKDCSDDKAKIQGLYGIGIKHDLSGEFEEALNYFNTGYDLAERNKDKIMMVSFIEAIAFVQQNKGQEELSILTLQKAEPLAQELGPSFVAILYSNLANILLDQRKYNEALVYAEKSLQLAEDHKNLSLSSTNLFTISEAAHQQGNYKLAADSYKRNQVFLDSIYNTEKMSLIHDIEARYQNEQKEKENQVLLLAQEKDQALIKQKTFQTRAISIISILTGLLAILAFRAYRARIGNLKDLELRVKNRTIELEESNKKLKQSNQELEQFAYISSHDLKQPLRNILDFANLLQTKKRDLLDGEANSYVKVISDSSARLDNLINDMLSYSVIGKSVEQKKIDCNEVMAEVLTDLEVQIKEKNARIMSDFLPTINGYRTEIHSLFLNLISNSIKYSKPGVKPLIKLQAKEDKTFFNFQIIDKPK